jgi:hypothetical protein
VFHPSSVWKSIVAQKRQEVLDECIAKLPKGIIANNGRIIHPASNNVKVVDKRYFEKSCQVAEWHCIINKITKQYCLNDEQSCVFNIVANYIAFNEQEPLKIYIGGIEGI